MLSKLIIFIKLSIGKKIPKQEFKSLVKTLAKRDWHLLYEYCLKKLDPALDFSYANDSNQKRFVFQGRGFGTLKPYRILKKSNQQTFEKIFFNGTDDLKANLYFYEMRHHLLKETKIRIPEYKMIIKGEVFTVFLYEYLELKPLPEGLVYNDIMNKTLELYKISPNQDHAEPITYNKYIFGRNRLIENNELTPLELAHLDQLIERAPVCFQHLDLSENNVFQDDIVIDWDSSGFYPLGMDFGRLMLCDFIFHKDDFIHSYEKKLTDYFQHLHHDISYHDFQLLCMYFFIVFYYGHSSGTAHTQKIMPFIQEFKTLINTHKDKPAVPKV